jgi:4-amino-4-deoxy-L-arabinose transferase-like glycosyltransferase
LLGNANVILVLLIFGILGHLDLGVYLLVIEVPCLVFLLYRRKSLSELKAPSFFVELRWIDVAFSMFIVIGLIFRFSLLWTYVPNTAWDALKFYLPWTNQLFVQNAIPNFDLTFNAGEPIGHSISFVLIGYLLYFFNGSANEILVYTISPVYALITTIMVYVFFHKLFGNKKLAYIAGAAFALVPLNVSLGSLPYVEAMLSFYVMAFFLYLDRPNIAGVAAGLAVLTKYSGFILPFILACLLLWKRELKPLVSSALIASLFTIPWYVRNILLYSNPLPFMAFSVKVFERPPQSLDVLWGQWNIQFLDPLSNFINFLFNGDILAVMARLILLVYIAYAVIRRRPTALYLSAFLAFLLFALVAGEHDTRYFLPFFPLCLVAFMDLRKVFNNGLERGWRALPLDILVVLLSMSFLGGYVSSYLLDVQVIVVIVLLLGVIGLLWLTMRSRLWHFKVPIKYMIVFGIASMVIFSCLSQAYDPARIIREQTPEWQSNILDMIDYIEAIPGKGGHYFLTVEDPGIRYYAGIRSYELTDPYGAIRLDGLFDSPNVQGVFFGAYFTRLATQEKSVLEGSSYENLNNVEADVIIVTLRFSELEIGNYSLILQYKGSGRIQDSESLPTSNKTWNVFTKQFAANGSDYTLRIENSGSLMLRFVLLVPLRSFPSSYVDWLSNMMKGYDIKYVILSSALIHVWVYYYYSVFAFAYLPEGTKLFQRTYVSDYWEVYEVR